MDRRKTLMRAVGKARRAWEQHVREIALSAGIPESYRTVIMYLYRHPGAGQRSIAEFAEITTSAVNQTVKSMLTEGYLSKETDESDKRNSKLYLTEKGKETAKKLYEKLDVSDDAITALIGVEKEAELIALLENVAAHIREI
ncbi:MAG: MarR family transcriptional regulator [Clostridia bacterium]|nr:MarR family transcriptional regulator [Clostridia bacterium]